PVRIEAVSNRPADRERRAPTRVVARGLVLTGGVDTFRPLGDPVALQAAGRDAVVEAAALDPRVAVGRRARGAAEPDGPAPHDPALRVEDVSRPRARREADRRPEVLG